MVRCEIGAVKNEDGTWREGWPIQCPNEAIGRCGCGKMACECHINQCANPSIQMLPQTENKRSYKIKTSDVRIPVGGNDANARGCQ